MTAESSDSADAVRAAPLAGLVVLELGQLVAGPFAGTLLGYFGADVVKIEPLEGDPVRGWRGIDEGTSLWWRSLARDKRCLSVDLRSPEGQSIARRLALGSDVLIENFRPGTLERWGLDPEGLRADKPELIVARVSGYGQTGPYARRPGYASVCEAAGGLRHLTGTPGEPPVRANLSLGDTLAGLHAALGVLTALYERDRQGAASGQGQVVDVAITESVLNVLEAVIPEYDRLGWVRDASGATITGVVPTGTYLTRDRHRVVIGANSEPVFRRLCVAMGRPEMSVDARFGSNAARVAHRELVEEAVAAYVAEHDRDAVIAALVAAEVPCGPIQTAADLLQDPQLLARDNFPSVEVNGRPLRLPAIAPRLSRTPGRTCAAGPDLGAHTDEVLTGRLGMSPTEINRLRAAGIIR